MATVNTPYSDLLPPLSTEEKAALKADIKANGVRNPVFLDEDGNVLDGHHRLAIDPKAPTKIIRGLTEGEKQAFVYRANCNRRNLSPSQKTEMRKQMKATAKLLREENRKYWTQKRVAEVLGVSRQCVDHWFNRDSGSVAPSSTPSKPNASVKVPPERRPEIAERIAAGENREQVAADFGVTGRQIATIATKQQKEVDLRKQREADARKVKGTCGILHGDFREAEIADESVQLIVTDPPYSKDSISLYADLGTFAARVLCKGGWVLAYSGKAHLPEVLAGMQVPGLQYGWTFCVLHSGGDARFRKFKLQTGWKPVVAFYRPPLAASWDWFKDVVSGGKEKADHEWQQAEAEAAHFIKHLSSANAVVCDPFCGSGTTLAAAK